MFYWWVSDLVGSKNLSSREQINSISLIARRHCAGLWCALVLIAEKKAKEAENMKRLLAKRAREDNARAWRKLKTESQIIGVLMSSNGDFSIDDRNRPVPGGTLVIIQLFFFFFFETNLMLVLLRLFECYILSILYPSAILVSLCCPVATLQWTSYCDVKLIIINFFRIDCCSEMDACGFLSDHSLHLNWWILTQALTHVLCSMHFAFVSVIDDKTSSQCLIVDGLCYSANKLFLSLVCRASLYLQVKKKSDEVFEDLFIQWSRNSVSVAARMK